MDIDAGQPVARVVGAGREALGYIERAEDIDLFYLGDLASGDTVHVELGSLAEDYALRLQRRLNLLGGCGGSSLWTSATSDNAGTLDESITYTASAFNLPRYVRVTSSVGNFAPMAPYDLRAVITRPEASGSNGSIATAQGLPDTFEEFRVAGTTSGFSDQDFYRFRVAGNGPISLSAPGRRVKLLSASGSELASGIGSVTYSPGFVFPGVSYTYYAVVLVKPQFPLTGSYTLTIEH
ncbi:MAG: hypothetical protein MI919_18595 [Holophagales bacterium]|nr:hypothetical protein [Holophagales bacterium]